MKHVLITGGSDGLGKITARKLIETDFKVTILSRNTKKTEAAAKEIGCGFVVADVTDYKAVESAVQQAIKSNGPVDILINNAGIWIQDALEANDPAYIEQVIKVNSLGPIYCTRAVVSSMKDRKSGRIINISSQGGLYGKAERSVYTASKFALTGFTKAMQAELKPFNIAVDGFYPGAMNAPMDLSIFAKSGNVRDMSNGVDQAVVAEAIVFVCKLPDGIRITELGIESLAY